MVLNNTAGTAGLDTKDTCTFKCLPAPPRVFLVSPKEMMEMSAGLLSLFLVRICQNLQAAWVLMSGIAVFWERMFTPVIASFPISSSTTEADFYFCNASCNFSFLF